MNPDWSVAPTDLRDYLKALGWSSLGAAAALRDRLYVLENSQYPRRQLVFPMDASAPDYREAVQIVREKLAELTGVHPDILDARIQTTTPPWRAESMTNETNTTLSVNESGDLKPGERPLLLADQGFSLLRYFTTDQEEFDEVDVFEECIAPLAGVIARKCGEIGIPCYMVFTPGHAEKGLVVRDMLTSAGPERLTHPVLMAAAAVRCDGEEAVRYMEQAIAETSALRAAATRARRALERYIEITKKEATRLDCKATDVATLEGMAEGARRAALYMEDVFKALHGEGQP